MIEVYSNNITVNADAAIPFTTVALEKGCSTKLQGTSTIQLNKCGIYEVSVSATAGAVAAGDVTIQLYKDNTPQPQALASCTSTGTTDIHSLSFTTLVQVAENNGPCPCASPTNITVVNAGVEAEFSVVDITVVRV